MADAFGQLLAPSADWLDFPAHPPVRRRGADISSRHNCPAYVQLVALRPTCLLAAGRRVVTILPPAALPCLMLHIYAHCAALSRST